MKKHLFTRSLTAILILVLIALPFAGCGSQSGSESDSDSTSGGAATENASADAIESLKTIKDIFELETEDDQTAVYEDKVVYAFKYEDKYYRAIADISEKDAEKYMNISFEDEDFEEQQRAIIDPLKIKKIEDLTDQILSDDELAAIEGKTGQELVDEGWVYQGSYELESMKAWMEYGPFCYTVTFDGSVEEENDDDFDIEAATKDMKVTSATFEMFGDATTIEE